MKDFIRIISVCLAITFFYSWITPVYCQENSRENTNELTSEEIEYIKANPNVITAIDPGFVPYEFIDSDGKYKGIAADYIELIEDKTGLNFIVLEDLTWVQAYELALAGEVDVLPCVGITSQRKQFFDFSDVYESFQRVLLSRADDITYSFDDLEGIKIGVQQNSSHYSFLTDYKNINEPVLFENNDRLILALMYGDIDVAVTNYAASRYRIKELGVTNIKVDEIIDMSTTELAMAVKKDSPLLLSIINKGLRSITIEEKTIIHNDWLGIEQSADYSNIIRNIIIISSIIAVLIMLFIYWNITLKKEIRQRLIIEDELLLAKKEAEEANAAKSIFLARMSHEIRTPLNAISGLGYLLENTTTSSTQERYIKRLKASSYNLLSVINDILDFSKIEAGEVDIERIEFSLDALLEKVSSMLIPKANDKEISLHVIKDSTLKDSYIGDPTKIEQILINLVNNAIKFTSVGGVQIKINQHDNNTISFKVCDTGIGISNDHLSYLFVPFHQLDSSITRKYGGTGLGLSICKHLVELLGGTITAESVLDQGTCFTVNIPLEIVDSEELKTIPSVFPHLGTINVLLYEEDPISRSIIIDYLNAFKLNVVIPTSTNEIISILQAVPIEFQLLIMNIDMKLGNTLDIVESVISKGIHVILLAKTVQEFQFERAELLGVKHIIMQPIIESILYNSIIQCFSDDISVGLKNMKVPIEKVMNHHILLAEDNEVNQMIATEILSQKGYQVTVACNGLEAVNCMKKDNYYELILMDIHMPIMDGYEATKEIRSFNETIPIIAMTAISLDNKSQDISDFGMNDWITKPIEPEQLFISIQRLLPNNQKPDSFVTESAPSQQNDILEQDETRFIDIKQGMRRINNNKKLYNEILIKFYEDMTQTSYELNELVKNKDYDDAEKLVHKVKGCSGNVGAVQLFQSSKILMDVLTSGVDIDIEPYLWEFENDLKATLEETKTIVDINKQTNAFKNKQTPPLSETLISRLDFLKALLSNSDIDAFDEIEEIDKQTLIHDIQWTKVKELTRQYNFKEAYRILNEFTNTDE